MDKIRSLIQEMTSTWGVRTIQEQLSVSFDNRPMGEYGPAEIILMHEPAEETFLGALHPAAALFKEYMDRDKIVDEHRAYRRSLEASGARVFTIREILLHGAADDSGAPISGPKLEALRTLACGFLNYDTSALATHLVAQEQARRQEILRSASPDDLVRIIMLQPKMTLRSTRYNTGITAQYAQNPMMNLFYMRDQMITTSKGYVIGRMNSPQREKECDIVEFCLRKIGITPLHRISGDGACLEGGDFYPFGKAAFIGCGMRTTQQAVEQLLDLDLLGCDTLYVVKDRLFSQEQMHLDTYFNIVDRNLATLSIDRMTSDPSSDNLLLADAYVRGSDGVYRKELCDVRFVDLLTEQLNIELLSISADDSRQLANNFLTVGPRRIVAFDGMSQLLRKRFRDHGVHIRFSPMTNLRKGYGAAHCMTQVLRRKRS